MEAWGKPKERSYLLKSKLMIFQNIAFFIIIMMMKMMMIQKHKNRNITGAYTDGAHLSIVLGEESLAEPTYR